VGRYHRPAVPGSKLLAESRGAVTILTIDRGDVRNAIDAETAAMLTDEIETFSRDDGARVLVMTGKGGEAFCEGAAASDTEMAEGVRRYLVGRERPGG
jgi:enoyl-CoA hydratase/carnithine racemase